LRFSLDSDDSDDEFHPFETVRPNKKADGRDTSPWFVYFIYHSFSIELPFNIRFILVKKANGQDHRQTEIFQSHPTNSTVNCFIHVLSFKN